MTTKLILVMIKYKHLIYYILLKFPSSKYVQNIHAILYQLN